MIPDLDLARVKRWIDARNADMAPEVREVIRYGIDVEDDTITVVECRPPWHEDYGPEWTRFPICRFCYTKAHEQWSLYWRDRNLIVGKNGTGFAYRDETVARVKRFVPYNLEERLEAGGMRYSGPFSHSADTVADGRLITGQNPNSATETAKA